MRNYNKFIKAGMIICFMVFLAGCGYTEEEKELAKQYAKQGEINAKNYILDKYAFDAEVTDIEVVKSEVGPIPDFFPPPSPRVYVEMRHDSKKFYVYITGEEVSKDGYDNYQFDIIEKAFTEYVKNELKAEPAKYELYYADGYYLEDEQNGLINEYYDGSNLKEVLSENKLCAIFEYINDVNLKPVQNNGNLNDFVGDGVLLFVKYPTKDAFDKASTHSYNITGFSQTDDLYKNGIYIENALLKYDTEDAYYEFELSEYDGFYYFADDKNDKIEFSKALAEDPSKWKYRGTVDPRIISDTYAVGNSTGAIHIYFPISKINKPDKFKEIYLGISYIREGEKHYDTDILMFDKAGDYYHLVLYPRDYSDYKFTFLGDTR